MALEDGINFHLKKENNFSDTFGNISDGVPNGTGFVADDPVGTFSSEYDGINDRTVYTDEPNLNMGLNDFTYAAVVKLKSITALGHIFDKGFGSALRIRLGPLSSGGKLVATIGNGNFFSPLIAPDIINFHLIMLSVDRDSGASFIQLDSTFWTFNPSGQQTRDLTTLRDFVMGARDDGALNFLGMTLSQFTNWNTRALSQAEGLEYYNGGAFKDLNPVAAAGRRRRILIGRT